MIRGLLLGLLAAALLLVSAEALLRVGMRLRDGAWPRTRAAAFHEQIRLLRRIYRGHAYLNTAPREGGEAAVFGKRARLDRLGSSGSVLAERRSVRDAGLATLAWRLRGELRRTDTAAPLAIEGLVLEIVAGAARERELRVSGGAPRWLAAARDCLHDATWTGGLGELASEVGVHPVTLARGFRRAYGCSVGEYLRLVRVSRAARRMAETDDSLAEIALAAGFADQSHFTKVFRRSTGVAPSVFRTAVRGR